MGVKFLSLLLIPSFIFAQKTIDVEKESGDVVGAGLFFTGSGAPYSPYKYVRVISGSPFFKEDWMKGVALLENGNSARCNHMKLDLLSGEIIYKDSAGTELTAISPIVRLTLTDSISGKDYVFINTSTARSSGKRSNDGWYLLLESGTASLYKKIKKTIRESQPYNSGVTEQTIDTKNLYFLEISNEFTAVKKLNDISSALTDKKIELDKFIDASKLNGKTEMDFISVVAKYNDLAVNK
ncbi:MAG: hypothetical protein ABUT20_14885 [Bacteroidota bacterium]